ncbi:MAG: C25 family cysteine peptidase [Ignavibacteriaceae bacterium]|nr:C25 family cysteine peptidase [Ignavibacteriaceae bacterium]
MKKLLQIHLILVFIFVYSGIVKSQNYDYLIIAPDVFLQDATWDNELLNLQTSRGFVALIEEVSIGDSREYIQGRIQYYYNTYPIKYVLLMGNGKTVGGFPGTDGGYQWQPEDQGRVVQEVDYLSGTYIPFWDVESNNPFDPSGTSAVASDDPYTEGLTSHGPVYIGRAPVASITEADNYVSKLIAYYQQLNS